MNSPISRSLPPSISESRDVPDTNCPQSQNETFVGKLRGDNLASEVYPLSSRRPGSESRRFGLIDNHVPSYTN